MKQKVTSGWTSDFRQRVMPMFCALVLMCLGLCGRLFYLQHLGRDWYYSRAREQQEADIVVDALRGDIRDRNGQPLATSVSRQSVAVNPLEVKDRGGTARTLGSLLNTDPAYLSFGS